MGTDVLFIPSEHMGKRASAQRRIFPRCLIVLGICFVIFLICAIWSLGADLPIYGSSELIFIALFSICVYAVLLFLIIKIDRTVSYYWCFVLLTYPFLFGQQLLGALGLEPTRRMIGIHQLSSESIWTASLFCMLSIAILTFGYALIPGRRSGKTALSERCSASGWLSMRRACIAMVVVLSVPTALYMFENISLTMSVGYGERMTDAAFSSSGSDNIIGILAQIMPFILLGLIITRKKGERWQVALLVMYLIAYIASGSRTIAFSFVPVIAWLWFGLYSEKSTRVQLLQLVFWIAAAASIFSVISLLRGFSDDFQISSIASLLAENNILVSIFQEAGQSFVVIATVLERAPSSVPFSYGMTYIAGIVYVLPNGITGSFYSTVPSVDELFAGYLTQYGGVGSSFIAEAYYNFGYGSLLIFLLYGMAIAGLRNAANNAIAEGKFTQLYLAAASFFIIAFYVRSDVRTFLRRLVWSAIPVLIVQQIIVSRLRFNDKTSVILNDGSDHKQRTAEAVSRKRSY